jgi:hypothetical protein
LKGRSGNHVKNRWHRHLCRQEEDPSVWPSNKHEIRDNSNLVTLSDHIKRKVEYHHLVCILGFE